jgi:hypothetical protein
MQPFDANDERTRFLDQKFAMPAGGGADAGREA